MRKEDGRKGILVVSFGTTYQEICRMAIGACEEHIARSFPAYEVRRAFTSGMIRQILKRRDKILIDDTEEALHKMQDEGFTQVVVQPLHIIPGQEYFDKVLQPAARFQGRFDRLTVGRPLLYSTEDYHTAVEALKSQLPELREDEAVVLMGHGTTHPANACYAMLQMVLDHSLAGIYVATVEGFPALEHVLPKLKQSRVRKVTLMPFMLVAGEHAVNDLAGEEEDSWKNILQKAGFEVEVYLHGLGENPLFRNIYVEHVRDVLRDSL